MCGKLRTWCAKVLISSLAAVLVYSRLIVGHKKSRAVKELTARPSLRRLPSALEQRCEFATEFYVIFTSICFGLASSRLGSVSIKMPSLNSAPILAMSTNAGRVKLRMNSP
jgi:hypothetical protein